MPMCEKCWADAAGMWTGDQVATYQRLVAERNAAGHPCTPRERAGQWWDEERQCDSRVSVPPVYPQPDRT